MTSIFVGPFTLKYVILLLLPPLEIVRKSLTYVTYKKNVADVIVILIIVLFFNYLSTLKH